MKARRKSDGEIIEVREWRGASDVIYSSPDMNQFYQASDLDFNLDAEEHCDYSLCITQGVNNNNDFGYRYSPELTDKLKGE